MARNAVYENTSGYMQPVCRLHTCSDQHDWQLISSSYMFACRLVMQAQEMPADSEIASFSTGADTGARKAAAALVIQEAYRLYCHRKLVKVCPARQSFCEMSKNTHGVALCAPGLQSFLVHHAGQFHMSWPLLSL